MEWNGQGEWGGLVVGWGCVWCGVGELNVWDGVYVRRYWKVCSVFGLGVDGCVGRCGGRGCGLSAEGERARGRFRGVGWLCVGVRIR